MAHEARINDALRQLGEEFRLGMVQPEEYRARRRMLLESWHERDVTTSPGSLRSLPPHVPVKGPIGPVAQPPKGKPKLIPIGLGLAAAMAASAYLTFKPGRAPVAPAVDPAEAVPVLTPASPGVLAARKAAEDFLLANAWEQAPIDALLAQWRQLSADERIRAREEPVLRTLRFKLEQNITAESQLVTPDAPPEDRMRLDLLTRMAQELDA